MMLLSEAQVINRTSEGVTAFGGLDHRPRGEDKYFYDMMNMTSDSLPVMKSRGKRYRVRTLTKANGIFVHDGVLCWADGTGFYYGGVLKGTVSDSVKTFVKMGSSVVIFPDKKMYDAEGDSFYSLGARWNSDEEGKQVSFHLCRATGEEISYTVSASKPESPSNGDYWLDSGVNPNVLRIYVQASGTWDSVQTVYTRIHAVGIGNGFERDDGIHIEGCTDDSLNGDFTVIEKGADWIVIVAICTNAFAQDEGFTVERRIPDMDFVCERANRLFGCSSEKHEVYASALGDAKNWNSFLGISTDSYAATVGSAGDFTGICVHLDDVCFMKESVIHKLTGTQPSNFQLSDTICRGTRKGSARSLVVVDEAMYYVSGQDICLLSSYLPSSISVRLCQPKMGDACAGRIGELIYFCMQGVDGKWWVYNYNVRTGEWVKEDEKHVMMFAEAAEELYMLCADGTIWAVRGSTEYAGTGAGEEEKVPWMLETGEIGLDSAYNKWVSRIQIHCQGEIGKTIRISAKYNDGVWNQVHEVSVSKMRSFVIPIQPRRCRTMKLRIEGEGEFSMMAMTRKLEAGSDIYR